MVRVCVYVCVCVSVCVCLCVCLCVSDLRRARIDYRALSLESGTRSRGHYATSKLHHRLRLN